MHKVIQKNVVIIGAGAAGLMCAAECGKRRRTVLVLDHARRACSKVRVSGGGRCNFTNRNVSAEHYLSQNPHFCKSALARFTPANMLALVQRHNVKYYEKEAGQMFCVRSAEEIAALLERECERAGAEVLTRCAVSGIERPGAFLITTEKGAYQAESLVIATGGLSYPALGASGFGHSVARQFGIAVVPPRPALAPFVFREQDHKLFRDLAGVSLDAAVRSDRRSFRGSLLFTHRGLSGPAALQASLYWTPGESLAIDFAPGTDIPALFAANRGAKTELHNFLGRFLPKRLAQAVCASKPINQCSDKELRELVARLHAWEVVPKGTEGYKTAEVTAGGVDTAGLSSQTMEAKTVPGLYFIGEVVDVTGMLGGYNLHWAWASGHAAGQYA